MATILVTGFEPFGGRRENPSGRLARALADPPRVESAVLPVVYAEADARVPQLLASAAPRAVLLLGLWEGAALRLERTARGVDEAEGADAAGVVRHGQPIAPEGPESLGSSLPLEAFAGDCARLGVPHQWSDDAGGFLCNHGFYLAARALADRDPPVPCGLVHVPPFEALSFERQLAALRCLLARMGE